MKAKYKIVAGWIAFIFVAFHLIAITLYGAPDQIVPQKVKSKTAFWVEPIFYQNWSMFAPCPLIDGRIKVKLEYEDGEVTDWIYTTDNEVYWYRRLRFTHHGDIALMESNILFWVKKDRNQFDLPFDEEFTDDQIDSLKLKGESYHMLHRFARRVGVLERGEVPKSATVVTEIRNVKTGEEGDITYHYSWFPK